MKKFSVILLVAVLAMTCVFADAIPAGTITLAGSAEASYTIGLKKGDLTYSAPKTGTDWKATVSFGASTKSTDYKADKAYAVMSGKVTFNACPYLTATAGNYSTNFALESFKIVKDNAWTLDFLGADLAGFATRPYKTVGETAARDQVKLALSSKKTGVAFTWNLNEKQAFTFIGAANRAADAVGTYVLGAKTPVFVLVEGDEAGVNALDIQSMGGFAYNAGWTFNGGLKMTSKTNVAKVAVAVDNKLSGIKKGGKVVYDMDASLDASFAPVAKDGAADVYFATLQMYAAKLADARPELDAKAIFRTYPFSPCTPVVATVSCENILAEAKADRVLSADVLVTIAKNYYVNPYVVDILNKDTVGVAGGILIESAEDAAKAFSIDNTADVYYEIEDKIIGYELSSTYAGSWLDSATLTITNEYGIDGENSLVVSASASTTNLVNGATIGLAYNPLKTANLLDKEVGSVVASCKISF